VNPIRWIVLPATGLVAMPAAYAAQYLSVEQAQQLMFPRDSQFESVNLGLTTQQQQHINVVATVTSNFEPRVWQAHAGDKIIGYFFVHDVIGKQDYITYAVALDTAGKVIGVEILAYRESHGYEIRNPRWRAQFAGKRAQDAVKLDADIINISGATLSCRHVTDGVRRILAIYETVLKAKG
jgi:Na+-translocating ferredoxin:NAD+ oxidoreductase RnfG subunit